MGGKGVTRVEGGGTKTTGCLLERVVLELFLHMVMVPVAVASESSTSFSLVLSLSM